MHRRQIDNENARRERKRDFGTIRLICILSAFYSIQFLSTFNQFSIESFITDFDPLILEDGREEINEN